ncbi:MAG: bifunctional nuclease family protein [Armatimonadota bacterium]|nr:bifunctional nuclease family protein [Armatimonadota bacterium]
MSARVEVTVFGVFMHQETELPSQYTFTLYDSQERRMSIFCGQFEAWAISFALDGQVPERPMTHDLTVSLLEAAGATVTEAAITDLRDEIFYAALTLQLTDGTVREIDARPSDAIALALRAKCPIFVAADVWEATVREDLGEASRDVA